MFSALESPNFHFRSGPTVALLSVQSIDSSTLIVPFFHSFETLLSLLSLIYAYSLFIVIVVVVPPSILFGPLSLLFTSLPSINDVFRTVMATMNSLDVGFRGLAMVAKRAVCF